MRLFVSYARQNKPLADALVADLNALGHQGFYDRDLIGGQRWWDTLLDQIQAAHAFVPLLSDEYRESHACLSEADWAAALGLPFVPIVSGDQVPGRFDPVIAEANWILYDPQSRGALADLARGIGAVASVVLPDPLPRRPDIPLSYVVNLEREIHGNTDIPRQRQLTIVSDLRVKLQTREASVARELLSALRARPDVTVETATTIEALLDNADTMRGHTTPPLEPAPDPEPVPQPNPTPQPEPPPESPEPKRERPDPADARVDRRPAWLPLVLTGVATAFIFIALAVAPWFTITGDDNSEYKVPFGAVQNPNEQVHVPALLMWLAVAALIACIGIALLAQATQTSRGLRIAGAILAAVGVFGTISSAFWLVRNQSGWSVGWGVWLAAVGLTILCYVTLLPGRVSAATRDARGPRGPAPPAPAAPPAVD